jgi:hypothetical protein
MEEGNARQHTPSPCGEEIQDGMKRNPSHAFTRGFVSARIQNSLNRETIDWERQIRSKDPEIIAAEKALRRAAHRALQIGLETGTPVYVIKQAKIVDLTKDYRRKTRRK